MKRILLILLCGLFQYVDCTAQLSDPINLDLLIGPIASSPQSLQRVFSSEADRDILLFNANLPGSGRELTRANGAEVSVIRDIIESDDSSPRDFVSLNGLIYFFADNVDNLNNKSFGELWQTSGTTFPISLTRSIKNIFPNNNSQASHLTAVGNLLLFSATDQADNVELWQSDGTTDGTVLAWDINPNGSSYPEELTSVETPIFNALFFTADDSPGALPGDASPNRELWVIEPISGNSNSLDINPSGGSNPRFLTAYRNECYFIADDGSGYKLWRSNGAFITQISPEGLNVDPDIELIISNDILYFSASRAGEGTELWKFDGSTVDLVQDINPGANGSFPHNFSDVNGVLYFAAEQAGAGIELWRTTPTGVEQLQEIILGPTSSNPQQITNVDGNIYFFATNVIPTDPTRGFLYFATPGSNAVSLYYDFEGGGAVDFGQMTPFGSSFYFVADGPAKILSGGDSVVVDLGTELWFAQDCPQVTLQYNNTLNNNTLCKGNVMASPRVIFNPGPSPSVLCPGGNCFSSTDPALVVDPTTGRIDLEQTPVGIYPLTYNYIGDDCNLSLTIEINVVDQPTPDGQTTTFAGTLATAGSTDQTLMTSTFDLGRMLNDLGNLDNDASINLAFSPTRDTIYLADEFNHCIRLLDLVNNSVTTLAGNPNEAGFANGVGANARFNRPSGIATDAFGMIYIADKFNHVIRYLNPQTAEVFTLAGTPTQPGDGQSFFQPSDLVVDKVGNIYVTDKNNHRIKKVSPQGIVSGVTGQDIGTANQGYQDGVANQALFAYPSGIDLNAEGNLLVADLFNNRIRLINLNNNQVSTFAGSGPTGLVNDNDLNGSINTARFRYPTDVSVYYTGEVFVADRSNHKIKLIKDGQVSTIAGGVSGFADGDLSESRFSYPSGVSVDLNGDIYIVDKDNQLIRKIEYSYLGGQLLGARAHCPANNSGRLTLTNFPGAPSTNNILRWEQSTDGGQTWVDVPSDGSPSVAGNPRDTFYDYVNLTQSTAFRAIIRDLTCEIQSNPVVIKIDSLNPAQVINENESPVCSDTAAINLEVNLVAQGGLNEQIFWYESLDARDPIARNDTLTVMVGENTMFYVAINKLGCESQRIPVRANVIASPMPSFAFDSVICLNQNVTYQILSPSSGNLYTWEIEGGIIRANNSNTVSGVDLTSITIQWTNLGAARIRVIESTPSAVVCTGEISVNLEVSDKITPVITGLNQVCENEQASYIVEDRQDKTYRWEISGGIIQQSGENVFVGPGSIDINWQNRGQGEILVTEIDTSANCEAIASFLVNINPLPNPAILGADQVCAGDTISYQIQANGNVEGEIIGGTLVNGLTTFNEAGTIQVIWSPSAAIYVIQLTETDPISNCSRTIRDTTFISETIELLIEALGDSSICENDTRSYRLTNPNPGSTYTWTVVGGLIQPENVASLSGLNQTEIEILWNNAGQGSVQVRESSVNTGGCSGLSNPFGVNVTAKPLAAIETVSAACKDERSSYQVIAPNNNNTYTWTVVGGLIQPENVNTLTEIGRSQIEVLWTSEQGASISLQEIDAVTGCTNQTQENIQITQAISEFNIQSTLATNFICSGNDLTLEASSTSEIENIEWFREGDNNPIATGNTLNVQAPGIYRAVASNACSSLESNRLAINAVAIVLPNLFSPNQDGKNERFYVSTNNDEAIQELNLQVFDRYGNQVYQTNNIDEAINQGWNGANQPNGSYAWVLKIRFNQCPDQVLTKQGKISLIR